MINRRCYYGRGDDTRKTANATGGFKATYRSVLITLHIANVFLAGIIGGRTEDLPIELPDSLLTMLVFVHLVARLVHQVQYWITTTFWMSYAICIDIEVHEHVAAPLSSRVS